MKVDFAKKYKQAPLWQKACYVRFVNVAGVELTDEEKLYLLWLAGWDKETEDVFTGLFAKLKRPAD